MPTYAMTAASFDLVYNGLSCVFVRSSSLALRPRPTLANSLCLALSNFAQSYSCLDDGLYALLLAPPRIRA